MKRNRILEILQNIIESFDAKIDFYPGFIERLEVMPFSDEEYREMTIGVWTAFLQVLRLMRAEAETMRTIAAVDPRELDPALTAKTVGRWVEVMQRHDFMVNVWNEESTTMEFLRIMEGK